MLSVYDGSAFYRADVGFNKEPVLISPRYDTYKNLFEALTNKYRVNEEHRHFIVGAPVKAITEYAHKNNYDIMVMGTVEQRTLNRLLGSTAESVLYRPPCSILAVKPIVQVPHGKMDELLDDLPDVHDYPF